MFASPRLTVAVVLAAAAALFAWAPATGRCQAPPLIDPSADESPSPPDGTPPQVDVPPLSDEQQQLLEQWIEQLGSNEFAKRELAAGKLIEMGSGALPRLTRALNESQDAETRLRAEQIVQQLTEGNLQVQINDFISGKEIDFEGWGVVQGYLGDSKSVRELFVDMMLAYPDFVKSLNGTARDKTLASESLVTRVQSKLRPFSEELTRADLFALLLIGNDPAITPNLLFENLLIALSNRDTASSILRDPQLSGPFESLLNKWTLRSSLTSREEVLLLGMRLNLPATLDLAFKTLDETNQPETIAMCLQAIAKLGNPVHSGTIKRFLDDSRIVSNRGFGDELAQPQVRDLTMLTLAILNGLPLDEIGMSHVQTHPTFGFQIPDFAYETDPQPAREKAENRIRLLLQQRFNGDGS